jgi:hypothetical protein
MDCIGINRGFGNEFFVHDPSMAYQGKKHLQKIDDKDSI